MKILDQYFDALRNQDWESLGETLSENVRRTGPYLDVVEGRDRYVAYLGAVIPTLTNYELKVSRVRSFDTGSAVVELSEELDLDGQRRRYPEVLLFDFDTEGRIIRVDIYIKQPPVTQ